MWQEKSNSKWFPHLGCCDPGVERMPHLDTEHIERIYSGASRCVCVPVAELLRDFSTDEMRSVSTGGRGTDFAGDRQADKRVKSAT